MALTGFKTRHEFVSLQVLSGDVLFCDKDSFVPYDNDKRQLGVQFEALVRMMSVRRLQILRFCFVYHLEKVILILQFKMGS